MKLDNKEAFGDDNALIIDSMIFLNAGINAKKNDMTDFTAIDFTKMKIYFRELFP